MNLGRGGRRLVWVSASFLAVSAVTRVVLALGSDGTYDVGAWAHFMGIGLALDLAVLPWFLLPWAMYEAAVPDFARARRMERWEDRWAAVWGLLFLALFFFGAAAEFVFWGEFHSRFDFIAVDYLIYTNEVLGNIAESYPIGWWLAGLFAACLAVWRFSWPRRGHAKPTHPAVRWSRPAIAAAACAVGVGIADPETFGAQADFNRRQLSDNGVRAFAYAYTHNEIDYDRYYPVLDSAKLDADIRTLLREPGADFVGAKGIERTVSARHPAKKTNVVLISVESLSANFLGKFGSDQGLTPELDRMADQGLLFTRFYATGTRTVRGLEALSVGIPPIPGQSIVRRPNGGGLENLGEELKKNGWAPYWIYGGYGLFDNMNSFFKANGYAVIDRSDVAALGVTVHHENIWGIADEDLYSMAMATFDRAAADGKPFFAHIMTTSNHRPYTFPDDRVDLPQKRRESAVKYTDWAIGDFIRRSASKPWFDDTLFIITADHTSKAAGRTDIPPDRYLIPMIWYGPGLIEPGVMGRLMSQIDVGPTLLGWLGLAYKSRFFGYDAFNLEPGRERAFISTYQKLGFLKDARLVVLDVNRPATVVPTDVARNPDAPPPPADAALIDEAIAWYQSASQLFRAGLLKSAPGS